MRDSQRLRLAGNPQAAIALGVRAVTLDSGRAEYWNNLGLAYVSGQRPTEAAAAFDRAGVLQPYNVRNLGDLASANLLLSQRGDGAAGVRARDVADRAVRVDPNNPLAHLTRAVAMEVTGDLSEALRSIRRALELDPNSVNPQLYRTATEVFLQTGRSADVIDVARRGIATLGPRQETFQLYVDLARALTSVGQRSEALAQLDVALAIRPNDAAALQLRAQIQKDLSP
jgi:tetratricopeptide (TPR) repeat protein